VTEPEIRGGRLRGMGPQSTTPGAPNPSIPEQAEDGRGDDRESLNVSPGKGSQEDSGAPAGDGRAQAITGANPYAGERKIQVNPRLFPSLWAQYEQLAVEIRQAGGRATVTDLVNAVLHYRGPDNAQDAHALLNRFRALTSQESLGEH